MLSVLTVSAVFSVDISGGRTETSGRDNGWEISAGATPARPTAPVRRTIIIITKISTLI